MVLSVGDRWLGRGAGRLFPSCFFWLLLAFFLVCAGRTPGDGSLSSAHESRGAGFLWKAADFLWQVRLEQLSHMFGRFLGAALGSVGVIGSDPTSRQPPYQNVRSWVQHCPRCTTI
ncbi:hypothetical protein MLD38_014646 [Melastoma candidum]|uniref:Uncharacterized protein n=1 Tax=Melastoma candidum TaxID=119954 RepID=A0ACB9RDG1_9MYRT|nr:hypothetical protein MLD38_014646 [Melastoma candidum]